jgi:DNA-directed RNA polymerase specialized sigma24 family protein
MASPLEAPGAPATDGLASLPVERLAECCAAETEHYHRHRTTDGRYGYQLFRRALVERDPAAWEALAHLYGPQLAAWARSHRLYGQTGEEAEAFTNQALAQLWRQVGPARFVMFPTLHSLLGYLQRCIHHLVIDQARARVREQARAAALGRMLLERGPATPQGQALARLQAAEAWALVRAHCRGEREERLATARWYWGCHHGTCWRSIRRRSAAWRRSMPGWPHCASDCGATPRCAGACGQWAATEPGRVISQRA